MKTIIVAAMISMLTAAPAMAASTQFDLKCKGTQQLKTGVPATAWSETFRIDLDGKRWCRGACRTPAAIDYFNADEITISDSRASTGRSDVMLGISRSSGKVREYVESGWAGGAFDLASGTCVRDLYSGMPDPKF